MSDIKYEGEAVGGWGENLDVKSMETWLVENLPEGLITNPPNWDRNEDYWASSWNRENYKDLANIQEYPMEGHPEVKHMICEAFCEHNKGLLVVTRDGGNTFLKDEPQKNNYGSIQK